MDCVGIGCFWFASKMQSENEIEKFSGSAFLGDIKKALEGIDNVSNVSFSGSGDIIAGLPFGENLIDDYKFFPIFVT